MAGRGGTELAESEEVARHGEVVVVGSGMEFGAVTLTVSSTHLKSFKQNDESSNLTQEVDTTPLYSTPSPQTNTP